VFLLSIGAGKTALVVAMAETALERKARIRKRLKDAETSQKDVTKNVSTMSTSAEEVKQAEAEANKEDDGEQENPAGNQPSRRPHPSTPDIARNALQRRQSKPANYKIHVVTALGLAITIRILALGPRAIINGK
jgi:hypothetical protein